MAFALVGTVTTATGTAASPVTTINSTTTNNILVVASGNADGRTITSVTDGSNTYTKDKELAEAGRGADIFSANQTTGSKTSVTVNYSGSATFHLDFAEFSGGLTASYVGLTSSGTGTGTQNLSVSSFSPTAGNLIVAAYGSSGARAFTQGTNYTKMSTDSGNVVGNSEYRLSSSGTETCPGSIDATSNWSEVAVEYKIAAGGGGAATVVFTPQRTRRGFG